MSDDGDASEASNLPDVQLQVPSCAGVADGFSARFVSLGEPITREERFLILGFCLPQRSVDRLAVYLRANLVHFCFPRRRVEEAFSASSPLNMAALTDVMYEARALIQAADGLKKRAGEPGELLLFLFLEQVGKAPRLACKMALKTNPDMPVHGADAIHGRVSGGHLEVIWGESKTYQNATAGISEAGDSITNYLTKLHRSGESQRDRDIAIVRDHIELDDPALRERLLAYFNPYAAVSEQLAETFGCIVVFDADVHSTAGGAGAWWEATGPALAETVVERFASVPREFAVEVYLLAVPSVAELRKSFFQKVGMGAQ